MAAENRNSKVLVAIGVIVFAVGLYAARTVPALWGTTDETTSGEGKPASYDGRPIPLSTVARDDIVSPQFRRPAPLPPTTLLAAADGLPPAQLSPLEFERLLQENPLKISVDKPKAPPQPPTPPPPPPPRRATPPKPSNLRLVGTIVGPQTSWAVINDLTNRTEGFFGKGDRINDHTTVVAIERSAVTVLVRGKEERLTIDWLGQEKPAPRAVPLPRQRLMRHRNARQGVLSPPPPTGNTVVVTKQDLNSHFRNLSQLLTQMRVQPYFEKGKPAGFLISSVRRGSFVERLGARSGDIIKEVNGERVDSVQKAFKLYNAFKNNNSVQVTVMRRGSPQTLNFAIK